MSPTTIYRWAAHFAHTGEVPSDKAGMKQGQSLLDPDVEALLTRAINQVYRPPSFPVKRDTSTRRVWLATKHACAALGLPVPHINTVRKRIRDRGLRVLAPQPVEPQACRTCDDTMLPLGQSSLPAHCPSCAAHLSLVMDGEED